jgi:hypothetical protein
MKPPPARPKADPAREARLAKALRQNLRRRKAGATTFVEDEAAARGEIAPCTDGQSD